MEIQYTKNLDPGRFELGTTLSEPNRSINLVRGSYSTTSVTRDRSIPGVYLKTDSGVNCSNALSLE